MRIDVEVNPHSHTDHLERKKKCTQSKSRTWERGLTANSGMDKNSSAEMKPPPLRSSWQNLLYSDTISCWESMHKNQINSSEVVDTTIDNTWNSRRSKRMWLWRTYTCVCSVPGLLRCRTALALTMCCPWWWPFTIPDTKVGSRGWGSKGAVWSLITAELGDTNEHISASLQQPRWGRR